MRIDEIPIYAGLVAIAILVFDRRLKLHITWLWYVPIVVAGVFLPHAIARLGDEYYNLAEMLRQDRALPGVRLAILCLLGPLTASCTVAMWLSGARWRAAYWVPASCLVAWGLLRRAVTVESIQDILGAPVLHWPADLEYIARFSAVYLPFVWLPIFFAMVSRHSRRWLAASVVFSIALAVMSGVIVNGYTPSDNVPEIFRPYGHPWFAATCLLMPWAAVLCDMAHRAFGALAAIAVLISSSALACVMLDRALFLGDIHGLRMDFLALAAAFAFAVACLFPVVGQRPTALTSGVAALTIGRNRKRRANRKADYVAQE